MPDAYHKIGLIPDIIDKRPNELLEVKYGSKEVIFGNELTPTEVQKRPEVIKWTIIADPSKLYTLIFLDPDVPNRETHEERAFVHWAVGNIPGDEIRKGDELAPYIGAGPPEDTGLHRYTYLVYEQAKDLVFMEEIQDWANPFGKGRGKFDVREFAKKYQLGNPVAGNFFQAQYDSHVDILREQLTSGTLY